MVQSFTSSTRYNNELHITTTEVGGLLGRAPQVRPIPHLKPIDREFESYRSKKNISLCMNNFNQVYKGLKMLHEERKKQQ